MRIVKGLASLALLIVLVVGIPIALIYLVGNPLAGMGGLWRLLTQPASDQVLVGILAIVGWIVWAAFTVSVIVELVNVRPAVRRGRARKITVPGLKIGQAAAGTLIVAVVAMLATSTLPTSTPTADIPAAATAGVTSAHTTTDTSTVTEQQAVAPAEVPKLTKHTDDDRVHIVERGDFLWDLAEHYLGDGAEWQKIQAANNLSSTTLQPGQRLIIPDAGQAGQKPGTDTTVRVAKGDSLSSIAEKVLGDADRWRELHAANRAAIPDPNSIEIGQILRIPTTNAKTDKKDTSTDKKADVDKKRDTDTRADTENQTPPRQEDRPNPTNTEPAPPPPADTAPPTTTDSTDTAETDEEEAPAPAIIGGVSAGLLLAAGLVTTLTIRRRRQLQTRPIGRTIPTPTPAALTLESQIRAQRDPFRVDQLDQILRAIAAHAAADDHDLPDLVAVRVADQQIHLLHATPATHTPPGITTTADGSVWILESDDLTTLTTIKTLDTTSHPWPALVTLGRTTDTAHILINLEAVGALTVTADTADQSRQVMATLAAELAVSPWSVDLNVTMVGAGERFVDGLDHPNVTHHNDVDQILTGLEDRATAQRPHLDGGQTAVSKRLDPALADAWCPHVVLIATPLTSAQADRLTDIVTRLPRVAIAAATTGPAINAWRYALGGDPLAGRLTVAITDDTLDWDLTPTLIDDDHLAALSDLLTATGSDTTTPAPWWDHDADPTEDTAPTATITQLPAGHRRLADDDAAPVERRPLTLGNMLPPGFATPHPDYVFGAGTTIGKDADTTTATSTPAIDETGTRDTKTTEDSETTRDTETTTDEADPTQADHAAQTTPPNSTDEDSTDAAADVVALRHPMLRVLGPPALDDAAGTPPSKGTPGRTMEVLFTLIEHPGTTNNALADRLTLSPGTTRPIVSRLRTWLGHSPDGDPYLPAAGLTGTGYRVDDRVTSDWHHAQMLAGSEMNTRPTETLLQILDLVRGTPFAGVIDDWITADHHVSTITAFLTDAAHIVVDRALDDDDLDLARHAVTKGLLADPRSEILLTDKVRIADRAGDREEARRLITRIGAHARELGVDLNDDTKQILAEVGAHR